MTHSPSTGFPHLVSHEKRAPAGESARAAAPRSLRALLHSVPAPGQPRRDAIDDWALLLTALSARLRSLVVDPGASSTANARAHRVQHVVLECAADLDLLHLALRAESVQRRQIEARFSETNDAVARAITGIGESLVARKSIAGKPRLGRRASALYRIFR
ncbi:hypothetical protein VLK31_35860 [Variovorax sp. H27-G14]|uniref:hypothetical protein n=1 Tax=Variovorax sp. H27-G14 TaxID=3111914 RepID=UPI0038FC1E0B